MKNILTLTPHFEQDFEWDVFKVMKKSLFINTIENIRNRVNIQLYNNEKQAQNQTLIIR